MLKRFVKRLLSCLLLAALFVLVVIGGTLGVQGWRLYRATAAQKPIAGLYDEISSRPGFASCDQLPQTYINAVISAEDSRFTHHKGVDPVSIARALVNNPNTIIADEPTGNLDPARSLEIMRLLERINQLGTTMVVVTHEKDLVNQFKKRVVTLEQGVISSDGDGVGYNAR